MGVIDITIIIVYVVAMFGIGVFARTRVKSVDDYLVAGHRFRVFSLVGTLMAALIGAGLTMGVVGATYTYGGGIIWNYVGFAAGLIVFGLFYVKRTRATGKRTMAEVISGEFGDLPRFFTALVVVLYTTFIVALCIKGMGRLVTYIGEGANLHIDITTAVVACALITIGYTALGGFYSVVWTDVVQCVIMVGIVVILGPILAITNAGGLENISSAVQASSAAAGVGASFGNIFTNIPFSYIAYAAILLFVSVPADPTVPQRCLAGNNDKDTKTAFIIAGVLTLVFGVGLLFIGGGAVAMMPNIADEYGTTEAAFPIFIIKYYPVLIKGLGIAALLAAVMSTISAMTLVGTTHLVYDAAKSLRPGIKDKTLHVALPIAVLVYGALVTWMALQVDSLVGYMYMAFSIVGGALLVPLTLTLFWKRASKWGITMSIIVGAGICIYMYLAGILGIGGDPFYTSFLGSLAAGIIFSLAIPGGRITHNEDAEDVAKATV